MGNRGFKDLKVWQIAKDKAVAIYKMTESGAVKNDYGLRDQMRRAAVSVASNIAEGDERSTDKDSIRFFYMAKGSIAEIRTQLCIAQEIGYISMVDFAAFDDEYDHLACMIGSLIKKRS